MAHRKSKNPGSSEVVWLVALAGAAYLAYEYLLAPNASAATVAAAASPAATGTPTSNPAPSAATAPPLGTPVTSAAQVALQVAANYPYIIPDANTESTIYGTGVNGYSMITTTDAGPVWLRNDVYSAVNTQVQNTINRAVSSYTAAGQTAPSQVYLNASNVTLALIQQIMTQNGLHGLGLMGLYPLYQAVGWN